MMVAAIVSPSETRQHSVGLYVPSTSLYTLQGGSQPSPSRRAPKGGMAVTRSEGFRGYFCCLLPPAADSHICPHQDSYFCLQVSNLSVGITSYFAGPSVGFQSSPPSSVRLAPFCQRAPRPPALGYGGMSKGIHHANISNPHLLDRVCPAP